MRLLLLLLAAPASAISYQRHVLENGLTVLLYRDDAVPIVSVNVHYKVGSKHEKPGKTGFAHLFEHLMFRCSANFKDGEWDERIKKLCGGTSNAATSHDWTTYHAVVQVGCFNELMRLESDRMRSLQACLTQEVFDKERGVVKEEKNGRESQPYSDGFERALSQLFAPPHPYHWPILGYMQDLEAATLQDVKDFHSTHYLPNNAVLAVAGALPEEKMLERARFWFEKIPRGAQPPALSVAGLESLGGRRESVVFDPQPVSPMLVVSFPVPGSSKPGSREAEALATILAGGASSRLHKAILDVPSPLALEVGGGVLTRHEASMLYLFAIPAPGVSLAALEVAMHAEIDKIAKSGITPRELNRIKAGLSTALQSSLQSVEGVALAMTEGQAQTGDPAELLDSRVGAIEALTVEAIQAVAARRLAPSNGSVVTILPPEGAR